MFLELYKTINMACLELKVNKMTCQMKTQTGQVYFVYGKDNMKLGV